MLTSTLAGGAAFSLTINGKNFVNSATVSFGTDAALRTSRLRRYAAIVPLALLLISGAVLIGCASAMKGTPAGTSQLTITATSGTLSQSTPATLTVQ